VLVRDQNPVVRRTAQRWITDVSTRVGTFISFVNDTFEVLDDRITLFDAVADYDPNRTATTRTTR
jgi:hypothetical protein